MGRAVSNSQARRRQIAEELENRGPTPETAARSRRDQVAVMMGKGWIDQRQQAAADEIRDIVGSLQSLYFSTGGYQRVDGQRRVSFHHLDGMSPAVQRLYVQRYMPWKTWAEGRIEGGRRYIEWVFEAIIDNGEEYPRDAVVNSLEHYADLMEG